MDPIRGNLIGTLRDATSASADDVPELNLYDSALLAAMATHDLREPLQAIQSFVSVMLGERVGPINEIQRDYLNTIYLAGRRLERLIQDVQLTMTRDRSVTFYPSQEHVREHVEACCKELTPLAEGYGIRFQLACEGRVDEFVRIDPMRLDQIVLNLLENAMRYATRDTVVQVRLRQTQRRVCVLIENQIDYQIEQHPREWFRPYNREGGGDRSGQRGIGLGLSVVAYLVGQHRGHMVTRLRGTTLTIGFVLATPPMLT
jgi:signal transduction histidine kinase